MQDAAFKKFRRRIFALYNRQAYAEALALLERRAGSSPGSKATSCFGGRVRRVAVLPSLAFVERRDDAGAQHDEDV